MIAVMQRVSRAEDPALAQPLVEKFAEEISSFGVAVKSGKFGAHMEVSLVNDGPVTFALDTKHLK